MASTISRRQILSRSRDAGLDHQNNHHFAPYEDYEEMWFSHEHLFKDHIAEVLRKWKQIDDEIWAKMIFMTRNRRIAKAYVRVPAVIIDGSDNGFDGYRVGLNGFEDPFRDLQTDQLMNHIDKGCRIGIDHSGNILIKRYSQSKVFVKCYPLDYSRSCVDNQIIRSNGCLEPYKKYVLFDMAKFELAMMHELKSAYPDRTKLEHQCIVIIGFVRDDPHSILDVPIYVMLINIVALDMLKSKLSPILYQTVTNRMNNRVPEFVSIFDRMPGNTQQHHDDVHCCSDASANEPIYGHIGQFNDYWPSPKIEHHQIHTTSRSRKLTNKSTHSKSTSKSSSGTTRNGVGGAHYHQLNSMPTLATIGRSNDNWTSSTIRPPKLPPRDRKKLSEQITRLEVEIPSPDYHQRRNDDDDDDDNEQTKKKSTMCKSLNRSRKTKNNNNKTTSRNGNKQTFDDNIYGTIIVNNGNNRSSVDNIRGWQNPKSNFRHLEEDPYYSGLEARVTSNRLHHHQMSPVAQDNVSGSKMKGLNWMMRKVLSANYINILTSKRHQNNNNNNSKNGTNGKVPKSSKCSTNESSTDSDPYVSINDMYEPIYGRLEHHHWPTMSTNNYRPFISK